MSSPLESYVVSRLHVVEQEMDAAHAILDMKQVPRAVEGHPRLTLAQRLLALTGELNDIFAAQQRAAEQVEIDSLDAEP